MAGGLGTKLFLQGDTLSADDVNGYFMNQSVMRFATTSARDAAFGDGIPVSLGGDGKPLLQEGMVAYIDNLNLIQYYNGSSWQDSSQFTVGDGTITNVKLAANSVTSDKIAPGTVVAADIAAGTVTETELANGAVTSAKILDGTILNIDISASAGIALSKLASATPAQVIVHNSSGVPTATTISGDVTISSTGAIEIANEKIVNADINNSAAIALSKLASGTAGQIIVVNSSGVPTYVQETGDITIDSSGVTSISSGVIVNADISSTAAIDISKIADVTIDTKTANYTLALTDKNKFIEMNLSSANTVSVPTNGSVAFPVGSQIHITQYGTGKTQIVAVTPATTTILSTPGTFLRAQYSSATLIKRATDEWYLVGDLSAT